MSSLPSRYVFLVVEQRLGVTRDEIASATRERRVAHARHILCWALKKYCRNASDYPLSYKRIGQLTGRHPTTVIHSYYAAERASAMSMLGEKRAKVRRELDGLERRSLRISDLEAQPHA